MSDYRNYKVEDFVMDKSFKNWVMNADPVDNLFWENWLTQNPKRASIVIEARDVLLSLSRDIYEPDETTAKEIWEGISSKISTQSDSPVIPLGPEAILNRYPSPTKRASRKYYVIAASVALAISTTVGWLFSNTSLKTEPPAITEKSNPRGQKSTVFLPDGSKVFLNSESSLTYDSRFNESDRIITLVGEAYFEVSEDPERPFTVQTEHLQTTALGTSFNVKAYPNELHEVMLLTGKVKVVSNSIDRPKEAILTPGKMAVNNENGRLNIQTFSPEESALWRKSVIMFKETSLQDALTVLERWYDVSFKIDGDGDLNHLSFTGRFENDYLSNVLESIAYSLDFEYAINEKTVTLTFDN